jgi:hypothetical protein
MEQHAADRIQVSGKQVANSSIEPKLAHVAIRHTYSYIAATVLKANRLRLEIHAL